MDCLPTVSSVAVHSKMLVLLLFIHCLLFLPLGVDVVLLGLFYFNCSPDFCDF